MRLVLLALNLDHCLSAGHTLHRKQKLAEDKSAVVNSLSVRRALAKPFRIERTFDIPYLAGYSKDGRTVFIDRHLPLQLKIGNRNVSITPFLIKHERTEKALIDAFEYEYDGAHEIATGEERKLVKASKIDWDEYEKALKPYIKSDEHELIKRVPKDLDLTPYIGSSELLEKIKSAQANPEKPRLANAAR